MIFTQFASSLFYRMLKNLRLRSTISKERLISSFLNFEDLLRSQKWTDEKTNTRRKLEKEVEIVTGLGASADNTGTEKASR